MSPPAPWGVVASSVAAAEGMKEGVVAEVGEVRARGGISDCRRLIPVDCFVFLVVAMHSSAFGLVRDMIVYM
jgi:hypothetical protein